jgi:hypothetical protein
VTVFDRLMMVYHCQVQQNPTGTPPLTFILPGFSKCGTTTLIEMLGRHPDLLLPRRLEPWFFVKPDYAAHWDGYSALFPEAHPSQAMGEDSTAYTSFKVIDRVADRIAAHYPEIRLLFLARDPIARIESSFREIHHSGPLFGIDAPFELDEAMIQYPQLIEDSRYWSLISRYRSRWPEESVHVVFLEDLQDFPMKTVDECFRFLDLDPEQSRDKSLPRMNSGTTKLRDTRALRRLRQGRFSGPPLARYSPKDQDRVLGRIGLRRHFTEDISWSAAATDLVRERVYPDAMRFLSEYGGPQREWGRLAKMSEGTADTKNTSSAKSGTANVESSSGT